MTKRTIVHLRLITRGLAVVVLSCLAANAGVTRIRAQQSGPATSAGQSETLLSDGRVLLIGGEQSRAAVRIQNADGTLTTLSTSPLTPRAWHTATLLSDGTVLIVGGIDTNGGILAAPELFTPSTQTFEALPAGGFVPRAGQTATLLTDGRVLIVGGRGVSAVRDDADLWDPATETIQPVASMLVAPRTNQTATLEADGRVLIAGGTDGAGQASSSDELFDPSTGGFSTIDASPQDPGALYVTFTSPANGASNVASDVTIAIRFSRPVDLSSVSAANVQLSGQNGVVPASLISAEEGRLVFVRPADSLDLSSQYTLNVSGLDDAFGLPISSYAWSFTTQQDTTAQASNPEEWAPSTVNGWKTGRPPSPWQSLSPLAAPPGVTAVAGQVLRLNGAPLPDVTLSIEGHSTRSDETGRFLILAQGLASGEHTLTIDGSSAKHGNHTYGYYEARIGVAAGRTTVLPFTTWSPIIDTPHAVTIPSPTTGETVITTPEIPGLELHLPAGSVIRGENGSIVHQVTITPIPLDRTPFPLPTNAPFNMYFTIQPGGAYVGTPGPIKGGWLVYPNKTNFKLGTKVPFYNYDPDNAGWYVYGLGTIEKTQVVPDPKTRLYAFTGASFDSGPTPPEGGDTPGGNPKGDPVDPSTGAFVMSKTDLYLPDVMPIALTRVYNAQDSQQRPFGTGMTQAYGLFQYTTDSFNTGELILPSGGKIQYVRTSAVGLPWQQTVFQNQSGPTAFYMSQLAFDGSGWDYTLKNGTEYVMGHQTPLQAIRDRYGNQTTLTYSQTNAFGFGYGNLIRITSPNGRWIQFTYDSATPVNHVVQATDNIGRTVNYTYDANGNLSTVTDPENNVTTYAWDPSNRLVSIKDGRNITYLTNQYDSSNRVTQQTLADPNATYGFAYTTDGNGNITQANVTDPLGHIEQLAYNADHYVVADTEAYGTALARTTTTTRQSGTDFTTAVVDPLNRETQYTYDTSGHVLTKTMLAGTQDAVTTTLTYEPTSFQLASVTDPLNHTWSLGYDNNGHLTSATDPLNNQTTISLNSQGAVANITDALQHAWNFGYTAGDLTSLSDPLGNVWSQYVDAAGRPVMFTDPLGHTSKTTFDKINRVTMFTDSIAGSTVFAYDANSNLSSVSDALSHTTSYTYDDSDRMASRTDPMSHKETYAYDLNSYFSELTDRKNQTTGFSNDALDRLTEVTFNDQSTISYTYDAGDRVVKIVDSTNGTISRQYDDLNRVTEETTPEGTIDYTYDADGRRTSMTVAGQSAVSYDYDADGHVTSITQGTATASMTYDSDGRRATLTYPNGIVATYTYDNVGHLTGITFVLGQVTLGDLSYTYDAVGDRLTVGGSWARTNLPPALASATYDAANRVETWAGVSSAYDLDGNLTSDGTNVYTWDARGRLTAISGASSASFAYDALGRRSGKTVSGATTNFLYDGQSVVQELSGGSPTANVLGGQGIDEILTRTDGSGTSSYLVDALGSTLGLADNTGTVQTTYTYEPFGEATVSGAGSSNAATFTGRESDGTGLNFYRARYYDPRSQRFISEDPLGFGGGSTNLFAYANNRPTVLTDPTGKNPLLILPIAGCIGGAIGAGISGGWSARKLGLGCAAGALIGLGAAEAAAAEAAAAAAAAAEAAAAGADAAAAAAEAAAEAADADAAAAASEDGSSADSYHGSRRTQLKNPPYQPTRNVPTTIGDQEYTAHALDQMENRGIMPSVVNNTIENGIPSAGADGATVYTDPVNGVRVIVNPQGQIVTVSYGGGL